MIIAGIAAFYLYSRSRPAAPALPGMPAAPGAQPPSEPKPEELLDEGKEALEKTQEMVEKGAEAAAAAAPVAGAVFSTAGLVVAAIAVLVGNLLYIKDKLNSYKKSLEHREEYKLQAIKAAQERVAADALLRETRGRNLQALAAIIVITRAAGADTAALQEEHDVLSKLIFEDYSAGGGAYIYGRDFS